MATMDFRLRGNDGGGGEGRNRRRYPLADMNFFATHS